MGAILEFAIAYYLKKIKTHLLTNSEGKMFSASNGFLELLGKLTCKFTSPEETIETETALKEHKIYPLEEYKIL